MPLSSGDVGNVQKRIFAMLMDTINTLRMIDENANLLFGDNSASVRAAIKEFLQDFVDKPGQADQKQPEAIVFEIPREVLQRVGFYGAQLNIKEQQIKKANNEVRASLAQPALGIFRRPFKKWIDVVNNFLRSLASSVGLAEALMELKDCLRDELPEKD